MRHTVRIELPLKEIKREATSFTVSVNGKQMGALDVSNGSITWYSGSKTDNNAHRLTWKDFDALMTGKTGK